MKLLRSSEVDWRNLVDGRADTKKKNKISKHFFLSVEPIGVRQMLVDETADAVVISPSNSRWSTRVCGNHSRIAACR